jgi:hypothetical protein
MVNKSTDTKGHFGALLHLLGLLQGKALGLEGLTRIRICSAGCSSIMG